MHRVDLVGSDSVESSRIILYTHKHIPFIFRVFRFGLVHNNIRNVQCAFRKCLLRHDDCQPERHESAADWFVRPSGEIIITVNICCVSLKQFMAGHWNVRHPTKCTKSLSDLLNLIFSVATNTNKALIIEISRTSDPIPHSAIESTLHYHNNKSTKALPHTCEARVLFHDDASLTSNHVYRWGLATWRVGVCLCRTTIVYQSESCLVTHFFDLYWLHFDGHGMWACVTCGWRFDDSASGMVNIVIIIVVATRNHRVERRTG